MTTPTRILVFPGATEIGLEINRALGGRKEVELVSASSVDSCHGDSVYRIHVRTPAVDADGWLDALNAVVDAHRIDLIYPAHDDVVLALAEHAGELHAGVVGSPVEVCRLARSKSATYERLDGVVPVPQVFGDSTDLEFPVFVKPDRGQGSQGATVVHRESDLAAALDAAGEAVVTEHLPGDEFTVDCFSDREAGLLFASARRRIRTRAGIAMACVRDDDPEFRRIAEVIDAELDLRGPWFFQVKRAADGRLKLLEFAPRIAGSMAFHRVCGVNFALLGVYEHLRFPLEILPLEGEVRLDRALTNRYAHDLVYDTVYVDLDDTLVVRGALDTRLVRFLFQCVNEDKRLVMLTRHAGDPAATLKRWRLEALFDDVRHLGPDQRKSDHVAPGAALFIDDSHRERRDVAQRCGIPVLDPGQIELLIDERT